MSNPSRVAAGVPTGGQFTATSKHEAATALLDRPADGPAVKIMDDVPGLIHGIKSVNPFTIQCDGCGKTYSGSKPAMTVILSGIVFNPIAKDGRRMCAECWKTAGWVDEASRGWKQI